MLFNLHKTSLTDNNRTAAFCTSSNHRDYNRLYPTFSRQEELGYSSRRRNFGRRSWSSTGKPPFAEKQWLLNHCDSSGSALLNKHTERTQTISVAGICRTLSDNLKDRFRIGSTKPSTPANTPNIKKSDSLLAPEVSSSYSRFEYQQSGEDCDWKQLSSRGQVEETSQSRRMRFHREGSQIYQFHTTIENGRGLRRISRHNTDCQLLPSTPGDISSPESSSDSISSTVNDRSRQNDSTSISASILKHKRVLLNVGGAQHEVLWKTLALLPNSRLGRLCRVKTHADVMALCDDYDLAKNEFFFDRNATSFDAILNFYRTRVLHMVEDMCVVAFKEDMEYWGINELYLHPCCQQKYLQRREIVEDEIRKEELSLRWLRDEDDINGNDAVSKTRWKIWQIVEKPHYSMTARIFALVSITFIIVSTVSLTIGTLPQFQPNSTQIRELGGPFNQESRLSWCQEVSDSHSVNDTVCENPYLKIVEFICIGWFTLEYLIRLWACPNRCRFFKDTLNTIDLIAIFPFYIHLIIMEVASRNKFRLLGSVRKVVQMFRILRIVRIFKLARHSTGLLSLGYTFRRSYKELGLLMTFVAMGVILFSSLAYFAEKDENGKMFRSIPAGFWWAAITMTTVGYGDMFPQTVVGKIIGSACCICGVLVVGLPIPIIVNNFAEYYKEQTRREKALKRRDALERARADRGFFSFEAEDIFKEGLFKNEVAVMEKLVSKQELHHDRIGKEGILEDKKVVNCLVSFLVSMSTEPSSSLYSFLIALSLNPSCITFNLSESVDSKDSPVTLVPPDSVLLSDKPTTLHRSATNPTPALGYPRIVIESETHSLSPEIASGFEQPNNSGDIIQPIEDKRAPVSPFLHDSRIQKLRQTNLRAFGIRRSTRPLRKLRRQKRCTVEQSPRRFSAPNTLQKLKNVIPELRSFSSSAAPSTAIVQPKE
ncbi:hypothetical protein Aperf_G00000111682 [Anoplocephala perfoliata]